MKVHDADLAQIKAATRHAIHRLGGLEAAALCCRAEKTALGEYQSINQPQRVIPVDIALQLDAALEAPVILPVLARLLGLAIAAPDGQLSRPQLDTAVAAALSRAAEAGALLIQGNADGVLDLHERGALAEKGAQLRAAADEMIAGASVVPMRAREAG